MAKSSKNKPQSKEAPRKHLKFGLEMELFTLNEKGQMVSEASELIKAVKSAHPEIDIKPEGGKNMIEINSAPHTTVSNIMLDMMEDLEKVLYIAEQKNILLSVLGTHPGSVYPEMTETNRLKILEKIFGKQRWTIAGRTISVHCHYSLPWGVFDPNKKEVKELFDSENKEKMVHLYNYFIAIDPVLTTFAQSSPFYQEKYYGKDSRMIVWRGGELFDFPQGFGATLPKYVALQPYISTGTDLLHSLKDRYSRWQEKVKEMGGNLSSFFKHGSMLDATWNPVKINAHGTLEQRGMDMNFPSIIVALSLLLKFSSDYITKNNIEILPSDIALKEPFKEEDGKLLVPPDTHVRNELQVRSAFDGLENDDVYEYCRAFLRWAKDKTPKNRHPLLEPLEEMLKDRKTISDRVLDKAKEIGINTDKGPSQAEAGELALHFANMLYRDVILTKQALQKIHDESSPLL